ncbi:peptidoglycan DD-metalloendopeptidase family protein [Schinkia azotoformans]|uniref:peptidoglycan DD-metalloendopeptidase family protein n=1 Tax=Schinkia azotoformans TaxID=1454 RepID=UPI002DC054F4|nr:peptidoglycan DD-metalloendopeptidase family protein [Schinkia azotoformans]MEC1719571.1 peptidoglycan DD-metalloendopeptidase family protein [Schinkia azotoformans]MED4351139.1 peptidoglycan DD-metalloendopeptidase family protein [Schinkia azotoformans]MED4413697.1 peptidoglycan DD-metalloendopeptidase family protein [Schinkia azotoformans]
MREEEKVTSLDSKWKRIIRKKWVLPSVYIASAALILTGVLWFQAATGNLFGTDKDEQAQNVANNQTPNYTNQEAIPVTATEENFKMPVMDEKSVVIKKEFYDNDASSEEQEAALVFYNNTYYPSTGIDIAQENGEGFDVVASLSGTVVRAENDPILGNVVEIEHENGVTTFYQSLDEMHVEAGIQVDQGDVIGTAGTSVYNKDAGIHVHFEIRQNNDPINPNDLFNKPFSEAENVATKNAAKSKESAEQVKEEGKTDAADKATEAKSADEKQPEQSEVPADKVKDQPSDKKEDKSGTEKPETDASISMNRG